MASTIITTSPEFTDWPTVTLILNMLPANGAGRGSPPPVSGGVVAVAAAAGATVQLGEQAIEAEVEATDDYLSLHFGSGIIIAAGERLVVALS